MLLAPKESPTRMRNAAMVSAVNARVPGVNTPVDEPVSTTRKVTVASHAFVPPHTPHASTLVVQHTRDVREGDGEGVVPLGLLPASLHMPHSSLREPGQHLPCASTLGASAGQHAPVTTSVAPLVQHAPVTGASTAPLLTAQHSPVTAMTLSPEEHDPTVELHALPPKPGAQTQRRSAARHTAFTDSVLQSAFVVQGA